MSTPKLQSAYNLLIIDPRGLQCEINSIKCKHSLNYSLTILRPSGMAFCTLLVFQGQYLDPNGMILSYW